MALSQPPYHEAHVEWYTERETSDPHSNGLALPSLSSGWSRLALSSEIEVEAEGWIMNMGDNGITMGQVLSVLMIGSSPKEVRKMDNIQCQISFPSKEDLLGVAELKELMGGTEKQKSKTLKLLKKGRPDGWESYVEVWDEMDG
jgi:hypothetical protein